MYSSRVTKQPVKSFKGFPRRIFDAQGRLFELVPDSIEQKQKQAFTAPSSKSRGALLKQTKLKTTDDEFRRAITMFSITPNELSKLRENRKKKQYRQHKKFIREEDKIRQIQRWEKKSLVEKADAYMTNAASIKQRYMGLCKGDFEKQQGCKQLNQAIGPLGTKGEQQFKLAMDIVASLSAEEKEQFWKLQERNRGVTEFSQLVTKREYEERMKKKKDEETEPEPEPTMEEEPQPHQETEEEMSAPPPLETEEQPMAMDVEAP